MSISLFSLQIIILSESLLWLRFDLFIFLFWNGGFSWLRSFLCDCFIFLLLRNFGQFDFVRVWLLYLRGWIWNLNLAIMLFIPFLFDRTPICGRSHWYLDTVSLNLSVWRPGRSFIFGSLTHCLCFWLLGSWFRMRFFLNFRFQFL